MKILVVDSEAEPAAALAEKLRALTGHEVISASDGQQALDSLEGGTPPDVLVTEVVLEGLDGFNLREQLLVAQPDLRTIYVTGYDLSEYQEYIGDTPVFYKPIEASALLPVLPPGPKTPVPVKAPARAATQGSESSTSSKRMSLTEELPSDERSQSSRLRNLVGKHGFTGKLDQFDLVDIIQLCCLSKRTGRLQIARRNERGVLYLRSGQIIHAASGTLEGEAAAYEIVGWSSGQFSFDDSVQPDAQTIQSGWEHVVMEGVRRRDEKVGTQVAENVPVVDAALAGKRIGAYELRRNIGQGEHSQVFEAVQTSMDRVVALKVLLPELQEDDEAVQSFLAQASARANVQHPSILAVYEAGQQDGVYYYTREFVDGANLRYLHAQGRTIDDATALQCIKVASEALSYLSHQKVEHPPITPDDVYLGRDGRARLNNVATLPNGTKSTTQQDIRALSRMVSDCLPNRVPNSPGLRGLLGKMMLEGNLGFLSWGALLQAVRALEPKVVPEDAFKLSAQDAAALAAVNEAKQRQKRALILTTIGMFALLWLVGLVVYFKFFRAARARVFDAMIEIPAGSFIYQSGEKKTIGQPYWIDQYEVTIGQYAQFLQALNEKPTAQYEHPDCPKTHHHDNVQWTNLYSVARSGGKYNDSPVDLNCPAVFVDWFDAYAYARWKGHRLPSPEEWEKAARSTDGRRFPWGNDPELISKVNTSADFHENGGAKGERDGYNRWSPVDAMTGDKSPYGVMDMAGNVSEWTASVTRRGLLSYPVICGGNFGSPDVEVTRRVVDLADLKTSERVGFRTVSDTAPDKK